MRYVVRKDKYSKVRGGSAKFYIISCVKCQNEIFIYQKDWPVHLLRMYLDRFVAPQELVAKLQNIKSKGKMSGLRCPNCNELLAVLMVYEKENRLAYRIINNFITIQKEPSPLDYNIEK